MHSGQAGLDQRCPKGRSGARTGSRRHSGSLCRLSGMRPAADGAALLLSNHLVSAGACTQRIGGCAALVHPATAVRCPYLPLGFASPVLGWALASSLPMRAPARMDRHRLPTCCCRTRKIRSSSTSRAGSLQRQHAIAPRHRPAEGQGRPRSSVPAFPTKCSTTPSSRMISMDHEDRACKHDCAPLNWFSCRRT